MRVDEGENRPTIVIVLMSHRGSTNVSTAYIPRRRSVSVKRTESNEEFTPLDT